MRKFILYILILLFCSGFVYQQHIGVLSRKNAESITSPTSFQNGVYPTASYTGCESVRIDGSDATTNKIGDGQLKVKGNYTEGYRRHAILRFDISDIPAGSTISAVTLEITHYDIEVASTVYLHKNLRSWVESEATWNIYSTGNNWTTAGAQSDGNDISGTYGTATGALSTLTTAGDEVAGDKDTFATSSAFVTAAQSALDGDGILNLEITPEQENNVWTLIADDENATASYRPKLTVTWS